MIRKTLISLFDFVDAHPAQIGIGLFAYSVVLIGLSFTGNGLNFEMWSVWILGLFISILEMRSITTTQRQEYVAMLPYRAFFAALIATVYAVVKLVL